VGPTESRLAERIVQSRLIDLAALCKRTLQYDELFCTCLAAMHTDRLACVH